MRTNHPSRYPLAAVLAAAASLALLISGCGAPKKHPTSPTTTSRSTSTTTSTTSTTATSTTTSTTVPAPPATIAAITSGGELETLNLTTGQATRSLASGASGDQISISPDGSTVYYGVSTGCDGQIFSIPLKGGTPSQVAEGSDPAISPDGRKLAFMQEPINDQGCTRAQIGASGYEVLIKDLPTGVISRFPLSPDIVANGLPLPVDHLSWSPKQDHIAVSVAGGQDLEQWNLLIMSPATDLYYASPSTPHVPVSGRLGTYYREGVYTPDGNLYVDQACCSGFPPRIVSNLLEIVNPSTGATQSQVAIGFAADHSSLAVNKAGNLFAYLSGSDLYVVTPGSKPRLVASGFSAVAL